MINIGIIGAGIISRSHVQACENIDWARVTCIADIVYERAAAFTDSFGIKAYSDYKQMIDNEDLQAVIITLPHNLHKSATVDCCNKGLNVLIEKPMAISSKECEEMIEAANTNGVKLMVAHVQRYFPENIKAKEIIASKELGELIMIVDVRNNDYFSEDRPKWFLNPTMSGGGIFMNYGAHSLDKIIWITDSNVKNVEGKIGFFNEIYNVEGNAQAFIELENGVTAVLSQHGYKGDSKNITEFCCTNGVIKLCTGKGLWVDKGKGFEEVILEEKEKVFENQLLDFLNAIKHGTKPEISGEYGLNIIKLIETFYGSSRG
ncbi:Gfo/Idh/MocA family oxidoreductase [Clostridium swellfunianum]|uniref:Gfo/Idh/MocA family protein n=1 Tax=Clostridium swellfunianum TaxID=1367462 RepID=UPI00202E972E|nr:Gfo/Idh/MocA family oxidoreductase [Clostridium swellfunianum]MCM0650893.1 Gfo/Idh/MocA family oxidoreductase [Clostridium swellfunianum]